MGEFAIRREGRFSPIRYQTVSKAEKQTGSSQIQKTPGASGYTISKTLERLMDRVSQAEVHARESRRTLQTGEATLAEVQHSLSRMAELAKESAGGGNPDRSALQEELSQLLDEIDRMIGSAVTGTEPLFLDGDMGAADAADSLLYTTLGELFTESDAVQQFPDWLLKGLAQDPPSSEQLLAALGLDKTAGGSQLLAALASHPPESNSATGYLAALYLGAIISGGDFSEKVDPNQALDGLRQLLETVADGTPLDQAIELLTDGQFTGIEDFRAQFTSGAAPNLETFLVNLLLGSAQPPDSTSLLPLFAGTSGVPLELILELLTASQTSQTSLEAGGAAGSGQPAQMSASVPLMSSLQFGELQVTGQDLTGVTFNGSTGELTIGGTADVTVRGTPSGPQALSITGSGKVVLQDMDVSTLTVRSPQASLFSVGRNALGEVRLETGVSLTLDGTGFLNIRSLRADTSNTLRLVGGAVTITGEDGEDAGLPAFPILVDGPASLVIPGSHVSSARGTPLEPFDILWKTLLPDWNSISSMELNGKQSKLSLLNGDPARLWLTKGDPSHGYPNHTVILRGRDRSGHLRTRYAYLRWNQNTRSFQPISMYPNPFSVVGGEPGQDWIYEEESHTLRILSSQVTAISGGTGTDGNQVSFSGRIALSDRIGATELSLGGVVCQVPSGRAFSLGRGNDVTLLLQSGTDNLFESGSGYAGISLGEGTSLRIDRADPHRGGRTPVGTLTAIGSAGGAGIGRDSDGSRDQFSQILIHNGIVTATGDGGGAGIGAGKRAAMGSITISGGTVTSTGGMGGGAGIGGALGAPAGDISIQGGTITAVATFHAAAIGAGVQGECGDILIAGTARIVKAMGGNPGADIGACLFGGCGKVLISESADIGNAQLRTQTGLPLNLGEDTVILPQFRLSASSLQLDKLSVSSQEAAQTAKRTIDADRHWVAQIQAAYTALYTRLDQNVSRFRNVQRYIDRTRGLVRDNDAASSLLRDMRQSIPLSSSQAIHTHSKRGTEDIQQLLR